MSEVEPLSSLAPVPPEATSMISLSDRPSTRSRSFGSHTGVITSANHVTGVDRDHAELGARTVRLFPYADTPNPGGVYKVWATPVDRFEGDASLVDNAGPFHGFVPAWSKTDT